MIQLSHCPPPGPTPQVKTKTKEDFEARINLICELKQFFLF